MLAFGLKYDSNYYKTTAISTDRYYINHLIDKSFKFPGFSWSFTLISNWKEQGLQHWGGKQTRRSECIEKNILCSTCDYTRRHPTVDLTNPSFIHAHNDLFLKCDNHMLHLSVKIVIPYKGLHLCLAIIPEEYNIIIYCHREWQWETVLMFSIAKQRKGSEVDSSAVSAHTVCACSSRSCFSKFASEQMQKIV